MIGQGFDQLMAPKAVMDDGAECRCRSGRYCHRHQTYGTDSSERDPIPSRMMHSKQRRCGRRVTESEPNR